MTAEYNSHYYDSAARGLDLHIIPASASQLHGLVTGFICSGHASCAENVTKEISATLNIHNMLSSAQVHAFNLLFELTMQGLQDHDCRFSLLLPSDDTGCSNTASGLIDWVDGFLTGLGLSGYRLTHSHDESLQDALKSLLEITLLDEDMAENAENDKLLTELIEFTRMCALMFFTENVSTGTSSSIHSSQLH